MRPSATSLLLAKSAIRDEIYYWKLNCTSLAATKTPREDRELEKGADHERPTGKGREGKGTDDGGRYVTGDRQLTTPPMP